MVPQKGPEMVIESSGAARAPVPGVKLAMEGSPGRVGPSQKLKLVDFRLLLFREPLLRSRLGPLEPRMGP